MTKDKQAPTAMEEIVERARHMATANEGMEVLAREADAAIAKVRSRYTQRLRRRLGGYLLARKQLIALVEKHPELFTRPKTRVIEGVKVGLRKQKGKTVLPKDTDALVDKIMNLYSDEEIARLLEHKYTPVKKALGELSARELKALGIEVVDATDAPIADIVQGDVESLVNELIKEAA